jgi:hypothetical protein
MGIAPIRPSGQWRTTMRKANKFAAMAARSRGGTSEGLL